MQKTYIICRKKIRIEAEYFPGDNPLWSQFEAENGASDINITCRIAEPFPKISEAERKKAGEFFVSVAGSTVYRELPMANKPGALSVYSSSDTTFSETLFTEESFPVMMDNRYMWGSVSLAQLLLPKSAFFMHASFISTGGTAILFSAPSGTGKSTQADLWQRYRSAEIVNGDKAGILAENGIYACGVPFCGTSGICKNKDFPLGAIVLLSQAEVNSVRRLKGVEALQKLLQNVYLDLIAPDEHKMIINLLIKVLETVPVYSLSCTADENAVIALEKALRDGGVI